MRLYMFHLNSLYFRSYGKKCLTLVKDTPRPAPKKMKMEPTEAPPPPMQTIDDFDDFEQPPPVDDFDDDIDVAPTPQIKDWI